MLKVMLINPPVVAVLEPWYDTPNFGRVALAYIASYLRKTPGYDIRVIDAKLERLNFEQTLARVVEWAPDVVGFTAFTNEIKPAAYQAALIKKKLPKVTTVIGGVHVTALPEQTLHEFPSFDIGVIGEGEETFSELCAALRTGTDLTPIAGLAFRDDKKKIVVTPERERILDQDSIPFPAWDLFPKAQEYWVQASRGCPFNCLFCMNPNGRVARKRSVANVVAELKHVVETYAPGQIRFGDEIFSVDVPRTRELMDAMIAADIGKRVGWCIQTHVRYVDYDLFVQMKKAGVVRVEMAVETGEEEKLKTMGKGTNINMIKDAFSAARRAGVPAGAFLLLGQPNETVESMQKTVDLAVKINPHLPMFGVMTPYPGTEVARLAAKGEAGYRLLTTDWDEYNKQIGGALEFAALSRNQIEFIQIEGYAKVFLYNFRFIDFAKFLWAYRGGMWSVFKKMLFQQKSIVGLMKRPDGYNEAINSPAPVTLNEIVVAREAWVATQQKELARTRKVNPRLLTQPS